MSWTDVLFLLMRVIFIVIAIVTLIDYLKNRGQNRLDIHLIFLSISIIYAGQLVQQLTGLSFPLWSKIGLMAFFAQPFLLLRLTTYYRTVPVSRQAKSILWGISAVGLASSWLILGFVKGSLPLIFNLILIVYFVVIEGYASWFFIRGARKTAGVTKHRMRLVASGSGLLALLFVLICVYLVVPKQTVQAFLFGLFPVIIILSAMCYYFGFLPPKKLRLHWQLTEIFDFQQRMASHALDAKRTRILKGLCNVARRVTGGSVAFVLVPSDDSNVLGVEASSGSNSLPEKLALDGGCIEEARIHHRSVLLTNKRGFTKLEQALAGDNHAEAILAVPIESIDQIQGILVILLNKPPLFPQDDQRMLKLLTGHVAIRLAYDASLAQLENQNNLLEEKVRERTLELESKAEQLSLSAKYKSEFLTNTSHELRTPLNSMLILSKMLEENVEGNLTPKQLEYVSAIYSSGNELLHHINEILDLSKIESGKMEVEPSDVHFSPLIEYAERSFRPLADTKGLEFEIKQDAELPGFIFTDDKQLKQILLNLLSNAFKFTNKGKVVFEIKLDKRLIAFVVKDTGIGIPFDKQEVIFEAFIQADGKVSRNYGGTGLGLAISQNLAHLLGGFINVTSVENVGSTFTLYLPEKYSGPLDDNRF